MVFPKDTTNRWGAVAAALAIFFVVSAAYFAPQFRGEVLPQHDVLQYEGMTREILDTRAETGEDPQWTGAMFSGMPAYLINVAYPAQLVKGTVGKITGLVGTPAGFLFFAMVSMWLMLLICGVDPWVGIVPALAYGLSTYFLLIIGAGHVTKMWALVYAPLMMGGAWMTLRGNMWAGAAVTALAASLEIGANHPQITYYFLMAMAAFWISEGIVALRERHLAGFARRTALLAAAGLLAAGSNFAPLWYTAQHSKETMRGGSELVSTAETSDNGLDLDYATAWSYGRSESLNLLVPDFMGRDSGTTFPSDGQVAATANEYGLRGVERQLPAYWGTQPYTAGPTYLGAAALFLALLGALLVRGRNRWWIVAVCAVMLLLAWGRNFMGFTELAFRFLPGYNKFRTVSMTLVVVQWAVPLLGALALMRLWRGDIPRKRMLNALAWAGGITGGLCLLMAVAGGQLFGFGREESTTLMIDQFHQLFQANGMQEYIDRGMDVEMGEAIGAAMAADRVVMMQADAWRSLLMIALAAGGVALFAFGRIRRGVLVALLGGVMLLDLVPVDLRFLSSEEFISPRRRQITASAADLAILADETPGYRVLNLTVSPFNDATTSYFHRSVGGYHGAKLARYQDLIDRYLSTLDEGVLDMLNTRYLILPDGNGEPVAQLRTTANGAAWFVNGIVTAEDAQQEIDLIGTTDLKTTAVIAAADLPRAQLPADTDTTDVTTDTTGAGTDTAMNATTDATAGRSIRLTEYRANYLRYEYETPEEAVAVFSEIFYDKGWKAYVDGEEWPAFRTDYVLRAMRLPAGEHVVEWRFRAPGWTAAEAVTGICSAMILLGALGALATIGVRRHRNKTATRQQGEAKQ